MSRRFLWPAVLLVCAMCFTCGASPARAGVPPIMSYSGELHDAAGAPVASGTYTMTFALYSSATGGTPIWTEVHPGVVVGDGRFHVVLGSSAPAALIGLPFDQPYYLGVRLEADPELSPRQPLVTLPYTFRAGLADQVANNSITTEKIGALAVTDDKIKSVSWDKITGVPSGLVSETPATSGKPGSSAPADGKNGNVWSLAGNRSTSPPLQFLGTTDAQPLVIKVNNATMMTLAVGGPISVTTGLNIAGNLFVGGATEFTGNMRIRGLLDVDGVATFHNSADAASPSSGGLVVLGGAGIGRSLFVGGPTNLQNRLDVSGGTSLFGTLGVTGQTTLLSSLGVNGIASFRNTADATSNSTGGLIASGGVGIGRSLFVGGATTLQSTLSVTSAATLQSTLRVLGTSTFDQAATFGSGITSKALTVTDNNTGYLATFSNTDGLTGDGLKIKLGRTHPMWDGTAYVFGVDPIGTAFDGTIATLRGWVFGQDDPSIDDIVHLLPSGLLVGTLCNLSNSLIDVLNDKLDLPVKIGPYGVDLGDLGSFDVIPQLTLVPRLPRLDCSGFPSLQVPNISFTSVTNSLGSGNEYIRFADKDDRILGAIRAESIEDWSAHYLDGNYFVNVMGSIVGIDIVGGIFGGIAEFSNLTKAYNNIGVEYMSGHGDYAEWLERIDHDEIIAAGDIVAVKGGKITKAMDGAEQVMAVSQRPIVLGNMPPADQESMGNKVAFVGQIPVKVQGPIAVGEYIVARSGIPGYGIGVKPADMTAEDFRLCVGRAWETNAGPGPKTVNTVVGVQNGDFVMILKKAIESNQVLGARLQALEGRVDRLAQSKAGTASFKTASQGN